MARGGSVPAELWVFSCLTTLAAMTSLRIVAFLHPALDVTATDSAGDAKGGSSSKESPTADASGPSSPRLDEDDELPQDDWLAARWSLGRGNTLVPSSVNNSRLGLIAPGGLRGRRDPTRG